MRTVYLLKDKHSKAWLESVTNLSFVTDPGTALVYMTPLQAAAVISKLTDLLNPVDVTWAMEPTWTVDHVTAYRSIDQVEVVAKRQLMPVTSVMKSSLILPVPEVVIVPCSIIPQIEV